MRARSGAEHSPATAARSSLSLQILAPDEPADGAAVAGADDDELHPTSSSCRSCARRWASQQTPPNQVLVGLALFLSLFVMRPVIDQINATRLHALWRRARSASRRRSGARARVLHGFMVKQTRQSRPHAVRGALPRHRAFAKPADMPFSILLPAFVTSELKTAFQIGFLIFLPFLIIDLVVASTLMALGMMMLSPTIISMPFKLLLFVLVDGWALDDGLARRAPSGHDGGDADYFIGVAQQALWVLALASAPILIPALCSPA